MSSNLKNTAKTPPRIDRLFLRFAAIYGYVWKGLYRDKSFLAFAKHEWASALRDYSNEMLLNAVSRCRHQFELPPTLPQFVQLCQQIRSMALKPVEKQTSHEKRDPAIAEEHLKRIAAILKKKRSSGNADE